MNENAGSNMTENDFLSYGKAGYNRVPVYTEILADFDTPLSVYLKLANKVNSYLLESVVGGEQFGRYSFIGLGSMTQLAVYGAKVLVLSGQRVIETHENTDPLAFIQAYMERFKIAPVDGLPPFCGGLVGYFGYNTIGMIEPRLANSRHGSNDHADILLLQSEELAVVDNLSGKLKLIVYGDPNFPGAFKAIQARLKELSALLRQPLPLRNGKANTEPLPTPQACMSQSEFEAAVQQAKNYIRAGDIFQVVLSKKLEIPYHAEPIDFYRALRTINPSPYMFYFALQDCHIAGSSPEILVRLQDDAITLRPLAGSRPRGQTPHEDQRLAKELLADEKELAEHTQLLDLGRNDVGRVAQFGSVQVSELMSVERYSHVMHIMSRVEGKLKKGLTAIDLLRATFPAGTLSGAPKIRAMEIIDELETSGRGIYAGAVGYLSYSGDMDLCIAIRTGIIRDHVMSIQSGAGIVADSDPQTEWQETQSKAKALLKAAEMVHQDSAGLLSATCKLEQ